MNIYKDLYLAALREANWDEASRLIDAALDAGLSIKEVYTELLISSQIELGELWKSGKINVAEEHLATEITVAQLGRLRPRLKPLTKLNRRVVVFVPPGDPHTVGAHVLSDFFFYHGWDALFLGRDTPIEDLKDLLRKLNPDLLAISITLEEVLSVLKDTVEAVRSLPNPPKIIIGGAALTRNPNISEKMRVDGVAHSIDEALALSRRLLGLPPVEITLHDYLEDLGMRIHQLRTSKKISQQELAQVSGLDRAYISSIENGKQNPTIAALLKISQALGVDLEEILIVVRKP